MFHFLQERVKLLELLYWIDAEGRLEISRVEIEPHRMLEC